MYSSGFTVRLVSFVSIDYILTHEQRTKNERAVYYAAYKDEYRLEISRTHS